MSARLTAGHGPGGAGAASARPPLARHHISALGVADVSRRVRLSRVARSSTTSREWMRGGPGGLWATSCSSSRTSVPGGGTGASSAERVPVASRAEPSASCRHA